MKKVFRICFLLVVLITTFSCKKSKQEKVTPKKETFVFNYVPPKPKDGKLLGVVELGAAGFNSFIIDVDTNLNWELKKREYGTSLIVEGMTNTQVVNEKLREYIDEVAAYGVAAEDIYFIVSSGAAKEEITKIISTELKKIGFAVNTISAKKEGFYALKSVLPKKFKDSSFVVDIGSGNTKISFFNADGTYETLETHGAKYYQKGIEDIQVFKDVKEVIAKIPSKNRSHCFMIGGVPTKLARSIEKEEELYTVLNPDASTFTESAKKGGKKLQAGLNIYKAIQEETKVEKIIYVLDGNFTVGFLLEKIN